MISKILLLKTFSPLQDLDLCGLQLEFSVKVLKSTDNAMYLSKLVVLFLVVWLTPLCASAASKNFPYSHS